MDEELMAMIESLVQEHYGTQGLEYLRNRIATPPAAASKQDADREYAAWCMTVDWCDDAESDRCWSAFCAGRESAAPPAAVAVPVAGVLENVREWIDAAPHGDNCFLHDSGEYASCYCGKDSILSYIDSELEAAPAVPVGDGWLPIETAPKQGWVEVLVRGDSGCAVAYFDPDEGDWLTDYRGKGNWQYVHALWWQPLPPAPSVDGEG